MTSARLLLPLLVLAVGGAQLACSGKVEAVGEHGNPPDTGAGLAPDSSPGLDAPEASTPHDASAPDEGSVTPLDAKSEAPWHYDASPEQTPEAAFDSEPDQSAEASLDAGFDQVSEPYDDAQDAAGDQSILHPVCGPGPWSEPALDAPPGPTCSVDGFSNLDGFAIEFPNPKCVFTLAEAAAGISIPYAIVVSKDIPSIVMTRPHQPDCCSDGDKYPFGAFEQLYGSGMNYCLCDRGYQCAPAGCHPPPTPSGQASYPGIFDWSGVNWNGPTDAGLPYGPPFPPGRYTLRVTSRGYLGTCAGTAWEAWGSIVIELVP